MNGYLRTPSGYCSSPCVDDTDCGAAGTCVQFDSIGKYCWATCTGATDCRSGYACFRFGSGTCFPSERLDCDPTAPSGACTLLDGTQGGCLRAAYGPGTTGYCYDSCGGGVGSCSPDFSGARQCVVYDERRTRDLKGMLTGDTFVGPVCIHGYSSNAAGAQCVDPPASTSHRIDACSDGNECFLGGVFPGGDNQCHRLCVQNAAAVDAGAPACSAPEACHDLWGLFGSARPIGLCY